MSISRLDDPAYRVLVITMGMDTHLYRELMHWVPQVVHWTVDVRRDPEHPDGWLSAPPRHERISGSWPDRGIVSQVKNFNGPAAFRAAVRACKEKLERFGVVIVCCRGGQHRAPTVGDELARHFPVGFAVHTRFLRLNINDVLSIVHVFGHCSTEIMFSSRVFHAGATVETAFFWPGWSHEQTFFRIARMDRKTKVRLLHREAGHVVVAKGEQLISMSARWLTTSRVADILPICLSRDGANVHQFFEWPLI